MSLNDERRIEKALMIVRELLYGQKSEYAFINIDVAKNMLHAVEDLLCKELTNQKEHDK